MRGAINSILDFFCVNAVFFSETHLYQDYSDTILFYSQCVLIQYYTFIISINYRVSLNSSIVRAFALNLKASALNWRVHGVNVNIGITCSLAWRLALKGGDGCFSQRRKALMVIAFKAHYI